MFKEFILVFGITAGLLFGIAIGIRGLEIAFSVPTECRVDGVEVFSGPSCAIKVESSGFNTTVKTYHGFMYVFPKGVFVSKDVVLKGGN